MSDAETRPNVTARLMTLDELMLNVVPAFLSPSPCKTTIRNWLDQHKIPRYKANPSAQRGGGKAYYSVPHVEKLFRSRMLPGRLQPA